MNIICNLIIYLIVDGFISLTHHYRNYNGGRARRKPVSKEEARRELLDVVETSSLLSLY